MSVEIDGVNNIIKADTISEVTSGNGVVIDGVTLKDNTLKADQGSYNAVLGGNSLTFSRDGDSNILANSTSSASLNITSGNKIISNALNYHAFKTGSSGGTERARLTSTGLGIGTTSPSRLLTIHGGSGNSILALQNDTTGATSADGFQLQLVGNDLYQFNYDNGFMAFATNQSERMRILSSGNVGIGTTSPSEVLHVVGDILATGGDFKSNANNYLGFSNDNFARFVVNDSEIMRVLSNGSVGIGESSPLGTLHVSSADTGASASNDANELILEQNGACGLTILSPNNSQGNIFFGDAQDNDVGRIIYNHSNNNMSFRANATEFLRSDEDGHVTMPKQPAFLVTPSTDQTNMANNTTIVFGAEAFDQNADFSGNVFTAPVTGKYLLSVSLRFEQIQENATYALFELVTSNRNYQNIFQPGTSDGTIDFRHFSMSILADMDANDTASVIFGEAGGSTGQVDVSEAESFFSGVLIC